MKAENVMNDARVRWLAERNAGLEITCTYLRAEVDRLRAEADRLDWLSDTGAGVRWIDTPETNIGAGTAKVIVEWSGDSGSELRCAHDLRTAIDDARKEAR